MTAAPDTAAALFKEGCNCAQAVFVACSAKYGLPRETALRVAQAFGGGMGRTGNVCGAVTGALMVIGFHRAALDPKDSASKLEAHRLAQKFLAAFAAQHSSILCRELLGADMSTPDGLKRVQEQNLHATVCGPLVQSACALIESILAEG